MYCMYEVDFLPRMQCRPAYLLCREDVMRHITRRITTTRPMFTEGCKKQSNILMLYQKVSSKTQQIAIHKHVYGPTVVLPK